MAWFRRRKDEEMRARAADASERADEAEAALRQAEKTSRRVDRQSHLADRLREGWAKVHERNNLADLFTQDYRRTHG